VCRICTAQCGVLVTVADGRVAKVSGDAAHPTSQGYTCEKGRSLADFHNSGRRLRAPRLAGAEVSWLECLDDLAAEVAGVRWAHGNASVGVYSSMGAAFESAGLYAERRLFSRLDGAQRYSALMYDCGPLLRAAEMVSGSAWELNPSWIPEQSEPKLVLFLGCNPVISHGYQTNLPNPRPRLRNFQQRGGEIWVMDVRRTETADLADRYLSLIPGSDPFVLAWLARELLRDGYDAREIDEFCEPGDIARLRKAFDPFGLDRATAESGLSGTELNELLRAMRKSGRFAVLTGTGVQFGPHALLTEWLRLVLGIITGSIDREGGMWVPPGWLTPFDRRTDWHHGSEEGADGPGPPSRPDLRRLLGEYPAVALVDQIEQGYLHGLFVAGGSPLTAGPEPERLRRALRTLRFLAVTDVAENEMTQLATHVLPVAAMFERSDVVRNKSHTAYAPALVAPPAGCRPAWWVWAELGRRLGVDVLDGADPQECIDETLNRQLLRTSRGGADALIEAGPHGVRMPRSWGWFHERALPGRRWRIAPAVLVDRLHELAAAAPAAGGSLLFVSRRIRGAHNAVRYATAARSDAGTPSLSIHPADAAVRNLTADSLVSLRSTAGELVVRVSLDKRVRAGTVSLTHGRQDLNVAALICPAADPLTGQPVFSGFPVSISPLQ
jgi:anaerobic selenocysteine-containing dehydrogenase